MTDRNIKVGVEVDASDADQGLDKLANKAQSTSKIIKKAGEDAGQGFSKVGEGSEQASEKIDRTSKSIIQSIQRTTVALESGGRTTAKYYETIANQRGVSVDALRPYLEQLKAVEAAQGKFTQSSGSAVNSLNNVGLSAKQTAAALRGVPAQFTDIVTSLQGGQAPLTVLLQQGGQLKDMFGGIGNAAGALGKYILGLVNPYTVAAAAIGAVAFAYSKANDTAQEFAKTLIVSGNAAGTTTDQMIDLANSISAAGAGSVKSANEAVNALVSTGKVSYSVLEQATLAVVKAQNLLGKSVEETSKEFADLAKSPTKSIIDLNEKYNFLTLDIYRQIKALEDQGRATEAAKLAQSTYAEVLLGNSAKVNETLTDWERGWNRIKKATSDAADAALRVFDQDTNEEQIKKLFKVRDDLEKSQASLVGDKSFLNLGQAERVQAALDANKAEINAIRDKQKATLDAAKAQEEKNKADAAGIKFTEQGTEFLSKSAKMTRELDAATRLYLAGSTEANKRTEKDAELQTRLGQIREKYKETIKQEENAYKSLSNAISEKLQLSILDLSTEKPLTEAQKLRVKLMEAIEKGHGKITQAQIAEESRKIELIRSNELMKQSYEGLRKEIEKFKPALTAADLVDTISKQDKAYADLINTQDAYRQSLNDSADLMQIEASLMGQSATDRNTAIEQYKIEIALQKELLKIKQDVNLSKAQKDELSDTARENANIAKSQAALKVQQDEWSKFYQDIYSGLTDSLYRGFEAGKGFFQSFWDGIKNLFKTTVLKLAVQVVVTGTLGTLGISQAGAAQANPLGNPVSLFNAGKSLYEGFATAGAASSGAFTSFAMSSLGQSLGLSSATASSALAAEAAALTGSTLGTASSGTLALTGAGSAGASVAAAMPYVAAAVAAFQGIKSINGDYRLGGLSADAGALLGVLPRLFGRKAPELQQSELSGTVGAGGFSATTRDVFKAEGGLFRSDKWSETKTPLADTTGLTAQYEAIKTVASSYASLLGLSTDALASFSKSFTFNLSKTGDAAKDAEANQKLISDLFGTITNEISTLLAPSIANFAKEGETASQTLARLATGLSDVNLVMKSVGFTEFAKSLEGSNAAARLAELTGGIEKLATGAQYFFENFLSDAEKIKPSADLVTDTLKRLGQSSVDTIDEFKNLVQGLDLATESGAKMYAELIAIAPQFKAVADYTKEAAKEAENYVDVQFNAQRKVEVAALEATQALEAQARATMELAKAEKQKTYDDALQSRLRSGKIGEIMSSNYDLNPVDFGKYTAQGAFDAAGFNSEILRKQAKLSLELIAKASADAINVEDVASVVGELFDFTKGTEFRQILRQQLPKGTGLANDVGYVMFDFIESALQGVRLDNFAPSGQGIINVINAQDQIGYQADLLTQYNRSLSSAGEALRLGIITQQEYTSSIEYANKFLQDQIKTNEELQSNLVNSGIESIAFYFDQIGKSVEELNKVASETALPLSQVTGAIGRLTSIADIFGMSANAAGGKESGITSVANAELVSSAASIAASVITSADAAAAAKLLADKTSFAGVDKTNLRDISLIFEGLKQFDARSFENSFMRMNDTLNKGAITQEQYQDIFDQSLNTYQGLDASTKAVADAMEGLRKSMGGFADQLLIDKQKTTLTQAATMDELLRQYEVAKVAAMTGEASSVNKFQDLANQVLDVNKYGSRAEYNAAFGAVYRDARNLENVGARQGENVVAELKNLNKSQTERIDKLEDALINALTTIAKNTKDTVKTLELAGIA